MSRFPLKSWEAGRQSPLLLAFVHVYLRTPSSGDSHPLATSSPETVAENSRTYGLGFWLRLFTGLPKYSNSRVKGVCIGEQLVRKSRRFTRVRSGTAEPKSRWSVSGWPGHSSVLGALPKPVGTSYVPLSALPGQPPWAGGAQLPRNQALSPPREASRPTDVPSVPRRVSPATASPRPGAGRHVSQLPTALSLAVPAPGHQASGEWRTTTQRVGMGRGGGLSPQFVRGLLAMGINWKRLAPQRGRSSERPPQPPGPALGSPVVTVLLRDADGYLQSPGFP